jgi:hypothetical protein
MSQSDGIAVLDTRGAISSKLFCRRRDDTLNLRRLDIPNDYDSHLYIPFISYEPLLNWSRDGFSTAAQGAANSTIE